MIYRTGSQLIAVVLPAALTYFVVRVCGTRFVSIPCESLSHLTCYLPEQRLKKDLPQAIKYGYVFGVPRANLDYKVPAKAQFQAAAKVCERIFSTCVKETKKSRPMTSQEVDEIMSADINKDGRLNTEVLSDVCPLSSLRFPTSLS